MASERRHNAERFEFFDWGRRVFRNLEIVPLGQGILHQINLERFSPVVVGEQRGDAWWAYPDTLIGTDSHTTMINALGVLGWGVGGIEAEAVMLGRPIFLRVPEVVGVRLTGKPRAGVLATDIVLALTEKLRSADVVGAIAARQSRICRRSSVLPPPYFP
jgi:aconitate hydratase